MSGLAYPSASSYEPLAIEGGSSTTFHVRAAGGSQDLFTLERTFGDDDFGKHFTLSVFPTDEQDVQYNAQGESDRLHLDEDDVGATAGTVKLFFVHASPTFGPIRLEVKDDMDNFIPVSGDLSFGDVVYEDTDTLTALQASSDGRLYVRILGSDKRPAGFNGAPEALVEFLAAQGSSGNFTIYFTGSHSEGIDLLGLLNDPDDGSKSFVRSGSFSQ